MLHIVDHALLDDLSRFKVEVAWELMHERTLVKQLLLGCVIALKDARL